MTPSTVDSRLPLQQQWPEALVARYRAAGHWRGETFPGFLRERAERPVSHDHLFHSVLGLMDVSTAVRRPGLNLFEPCTHPAAAAPDSRPIASTICCCSSLRLKSMSGG